MAEAFALSHLLVVDKCFSFWYNSFREFFFLRRAYDHGIYTKLQQSVYY